MRTIGNDLHIYYSAGGEITHLAARMAQLAMPGSIRLTATTLYLVEGLVQVTAQGPVPVKGPVSPERELEILHQVLGQACAGCGQVVAVGGEAGVGKSRLVYECVNAHHT